MKKKSQNKLIANIISVIISVLTFFAYLTTTVNIGCIGSVMRTLIIFVFLTLVFLSLVILNFVSLFMFDDKQSFIIGAVTVIFLAVCQTGIFIAEMVQYADIFKRFDGEEHRYYAGNVVSYVFKLIEYYGFIAAFFVCNYKIPAQNNAEEIRDGVTECAAAEPNGDFKPANTLRSENSQNTPAVKLQAGLAEEIKKYKELLDSEAITVEEYNRIKNRLLGL